MVATEETRTRANLTSSSRGSRSVDRFSAHCCCKYEVAREKQSGICAIANAYCYRMWHTCRPPSTAVLTVRADMSSKPSILVTFWNPSTVPMTYRSCIPSTSSTTSPGVTSSSVPTCDSTICNFIIIVCVGGGGGAELNTGCMRGGVVDTSGKGVRVGGASGTMEWIDRPSYHRSCATLARCVKRCGWDLVAIIHGIRRNVTRKGVR